MKMVRRVASPYNVNGVALACLAAALDDREFIDQLRRAGEGRPGAARKLLRASAAFLSGRAAPISCSPDSATTASALVEEMRRRGILVRDRNSDPGCAGCVASPSAPPPDGPPAARTARWRCKQSGSPRQRAMSDHSHGSACQAHRKVPDARDRAQDQRNRHPPGAEHRRPRHATRFPPAFASSITCWSCLPAMAASTWNCLPGRSRCRPAPHGRRRRHRARRGLRPRARRSKGHPARRLLPDAHGRNSGRGRHRFRRPRRGVVDAKVRVRLVGDLQSELVFDFFEGFARGARANVHLKVLYGRSNHHKIEALFKAFARALARRLLARQAAGQDAAQHQGTL